MTAAAVLLAAAVTIATAIALGRTMLAPVREDLHREELTPLALLLGGAALHLLVFATLALNIGSRWVHLALCAGILAATWRTAWTRPARSLPRLAAPERWLFWAVYVPFAVYYTVHAMAPEVSSDGVTYHLSLVRQYLRNGSFGHITTNIYANLSQGMEMLYVVAYGWGRHSAATLVHCAFLLALPWLVSGWARRVGKPAAGVAAALIVFTSPVFGITGVSAYNDVAIAYAVFGVFYLLHVWEEHRGWWWLAMVGLAAGYCFALKYTAFLAAPAAVAFVLAKTRRWRPAALVAAAAAVMIAPWLIKNWVLVDNPVSPFGNRWFPNPYVSVKFEEEYRAFMATYGLESRWQLPLEVTVRGEKLTGALGWIFLLTPLGLVSGRDPRGRRLLAAMALFLLPYAANVGTRFLMTPAVFAALALAWTLAGWKPGLALGAAALCAVSCWPPVLQTWVERYAWRLSEFPWKAALRVEPEDHYLRRRLGLYDEIRMINRLTPPGARVLAMNGVAEAYSDRDVIIGFQSSYGSIATDLLYCAVFPEFAPEKRTLLRGAATARAVRVRQTGPGDGVSPWSVAELRVFRGGVEIPRAPAWRMRSHPNGWDIGLAFDNDRITRWRSNELMKPGQWIEVDFGAPLAFDEVRLEYGHEQGGHRFELDGRAESGGWRKLETRAVEEASPAPPGLQQAAARALKDLGIDYLQLDDGDFGAKEILADLELWNLEAVGKVGAAGLYRIAWPRTQPLTRYLPTREDLSKR